MRVFARVCCVGSVHSGSEATELVVEYWTGKKEKEKVIWVYSI